MNQTMYLVIVRTNLDDLPILLTDDRAKAMAKANRVGVKEIDKATKFMAVDEAGLINTAIITFVNGKPKAIELIKDAWTDTKGEAA